MNTLNEQFNEKSVWTEYLTARAARRVAAALKEAGYGTATRLNCRGYVINVASYFEPGDAVERSKVLRVICGAAGIQPNSF